MLCTVMIHDELKVQTGVYKQKFKKKAGNEA